jgi:hypothetical protein
LAIKSEKKVKNNNNAYSCHDIEVVVLRVQGPSPNIEQTEKIIMSLYKFMSKTHCLSSEDLGKNMDASGCYDIVEEAVFRVQGPCPNIESSLKMKKKKDR